MTRLVPAPCVPTLVTSPEPAREGDLLVIARILIAKDQDRVFIERGARHLIGAVIHGDLAKRHSNGSPVFLFS